MQRCPAFDETEKKDYTSRRENKVKRRRRPAAAGLQKDETESSRKTGGPPGSRAGDHGLRGQLFHYCRAGNLPHFQPALCSQSAYPLTVGTATIAMHCVLIALQVVLLRKEYSPFQMLQLPVALVFGTLCDLTLATIQWMTPTGYPARWVCCLIGVVLVGFGVSCEVQAALVPLAGEGFILAVCKAFSRPFPPTKIAFDCTLVALACALGFAFRGQLLGVREGTIAAALLVGLVSKQFTKRLLDPLTRERKEEKC